MGVEYIVKYIKAQRVRWLGRITKYTNERKIKIMTN